MYNRLRWDLSVRPFVVKPLDLKFCISVYIGLNSLMYIILTGWWPYNGRFLLLDHSPLDTSNKQESQTLVLLTCYINLLHLDLLIKVKIWRGAMIWFKPSTKHSCKKKMTNKHVYIQSNLSYRLPVEVHVGIYL